MEGAVIHTNMKTTPKVIKTWRVLVIHAARKLHQKVNHILPIVAVVIPFDTHTHAIPVQQYMTQSKITRYPQCAKNPNKMRKVSEGKTMRLLSDENPSFLCSQDWKLNPLPPGSTADVNCVKIL